MSAGALYTYIHPVPHLRVLHARWKGQALVAGLSLHKQCRDTVLSSVTTCAATDDVNQKHFLLFFGGLCVQLNQEIAVGGETRKIFCCLKQTIMQVDCCSCVLEEFH